LWQLYVSGFGSLGSIVLLILSILSIKEIERENRLGYGTEAWLGIMLHMVGINASVNTMEDACQEWRAVGHARRWIVGYWLRFFLVWGVCFAGTDPHRITY
jgi:hypothetical protein